MRKANGNPWLKVSLMLLSLVGIIYAMAYFRSGKAFRDPSSPAQILLTSPADEARPARIIIEKSTQPPRDEETKN